MSTPNPTPTVSLAVTLVAALTTGGIDIGATSSAQKLARAQTVSQIAAILQSASTGNLSAANSAVSSFLASISDPGLQAVASDIAQLAAPWVSINAQAIGLIPSVASGLASVAAGMAQAAGAFIAKYGASTPSTTTAS